MNILNNDIQELWQNTSYSGSLESDALPITISIYHEYDSLPNENVKKLYWSQLGWWTDKWMWTYRQSSFGHFHTYLTGWDSNWGVAQNWLYSLVRTLVAGSLNWWFRCAYTWK